MKLSQIKYFDILFRYDFEKLETIVFSYKLHELKTKCDFAIIFGGKSMIPYRTQVAIQMFQKGQIKKIIVTGKNSYFHHKKNSEALEMKNYLVDQGIDKNVIIMEEKSKSTYQNIKNTIKKLKSCIRKDTSFLLITSEFHMRRCYLLFSKFINSENIYEAIAYDNKTDLKTYKNTKDGINTIKREALCICYYAKKKKIIDQDIRL